MTAIYNVCYFQLVTVMREISITIIFGTYRKDYTTHFGVKSTKAHFCVMFNEIMC